MTHPHATAVLNSGREDARMLAERIVGIDLSAAAGVLAP
jgi:hypothetical protein